MQNVFVTIENLNFLEFSAHRIWNSLFEKLILYSTIGSRLL